MRALTATVALALLVGCGDDEPVVEDPCDQSVPGRSCVIAGSGENGYDKDAETRALPALEAKLSLPQDTLTDDNGTIYVVDWNNHRLRSLKDGKLSWLAGRGELGGNLDDPANGDFNHPPDVAFDASGTRIIIAAWHNSKLRTLDIDSGEIVDTCGDGRRAYFGDGGPALTAALDLPSSIELDNNGDLLVMDQANQVIRRIDSAGTIHLHAGRCVIDAAPPSGPGPCADGEEPVQCPGDDTGESGKWTCGDPAEWCSSPCTPGYNGDDIPVAEMRMAQPFGQSATPAGRIAVAPNGDIYFADTANHLIRMIDDEGMVRRVAGLPPEDGVAQSGYSGDGGPAVDALINYPVDVELADDGTLFFADVYNHCVRKITPDGIIETVAGTCGERGLGEDGLDATATMLKLPYGVEWVDGRLHIADTGNHVIRTVLLP